MKERSTWPPNPRPDFPGLVDSGPWCLFTSFVNQSSVTGGPRAVEQPSRSSPSQCVDSISFHQSDSAAPAVCAKMPVPILQRVSRHFSAALHHLVYSFPSPNITDPTLSAESPLPGESLPSGGVGGVERGLDAKMMDLGDPLGEPGEGRAFAGGIGPLSFAGSGYGVTLVLMVSRLLHLLQRQQTDLRVGHPVEPHSSYCPKTTSTTATTASSSHPVILLADQEDE